MTLLPGSIRWRIQLWHGVLLLAVLAGLGVTAYRLQAAQEYRQLDAALRQRVAVLSQALALQGGSGPGGAPPERRGPPPPPAGEEWRPPPGERPAFQEGPPPREQGPPANSFALPAEVASLFPEGDGGFYFAVWSRTGVVMGRSAHAPAELVPPEAGSIDMIQTRAGWREAVHFTPPGECLLAGAAEAGVRHALAVLAWRLGLLGAGVQLLGLAGGWWVATRAIAPIGVISQAAARIADGHLEERIASKQDGSELAQLTGVLNDTFSRLESAFARQARFTSDAAHELRTPLAIVLAHTQLALARPRAPGEYEEALTIIQRSAQRMRALVEALLQLAILDGKAEPRAFQTCDLAALALEQAEHFRPLAARQGLVLETACAAAPCTGDCDQLTQILTNLLSNALAYCRSGDTVLLRTWTTVEEVQLSVADTGPGIAAEHLPHLFERFYRVDASRTRHTGGAGLGLAICRTIAEAHGGQLEARPNGPQGVVFTLTLPKCQGATDADQGA